MKEKSVKLLQRTTEFLKAHNNSNEPTWFRAVASVPPVQIPSKKLPLNESNEEGIKFRKTKGRVSEIVLEEDIVRNMFYKEHPWELARPKSLVEQPIGRRYVSKSLETPDDAIEEVVKVLKWAKSLRKEVGDCGKILPQHYIAILLAQCMPHSKTPLHKSLQMRISPSDLWFVVAKGLDDHVLFKRAYNTVLQRYYDQQMKYALEARTGREEASYYNIEFKDSILKDIYQKEEIALQQWAEQWDKLTQNSSNVRGPKPIASPEETTDTESSLEFIDDFFKPAAKSTPTSKYT